MCMFSLLVKMFLFFHFLNAFKLVKAGVADLPNVIVVPGKEYMVSYATFPAYF